MFLIVLAFLGSCAVAADLAADPESRRLIEEAQPAKARVQPAEPRRLLIFTRNVGYGGHRSSRAHSNEAFTLMGKKTGAFETTISEDPAVFRRESLQQFDAVFLNNTIGNTFTDPQLRQNLLEFVTGGGGLMGVHGTSIAFMDWQWPPVEDWPEFGNMIGARGAYHRDDKEQVWIKIDEPDHPLCRAFGGLGFERRDEFFRFHDPYSRRLNRVLLSVDVAKTDLSGIKPDEHLLRDDNDYAIAWIRNYGRGRVFYSSLAHHESVFRDPKMLQFYLDAAQFVLGDLPLPTTPSARLSPAILAQEKLGWRLGIEAYTFHKFTFFETIEKTAELGLPYVGGLSFMQKVSKDIPKDFDQTLTDDELRQIRLKMDSAGVRLLTYYAQNIAEDEAGCRTLFDFGRKMGFETFICEPRLEQLELLDKFANEYGINIAIHNHGQNISPQYWRPEGVLKACEGRSKRIGAAPDLGYWLRSGIDPVQAVRLLKDRIITVQMHDLHETGSKGHDVPWGTGVGKSKEFFRELHRQGIKPTMIGLEYSHDWLESMPKVAKCIEFFNAITLEIATESAIPPAPAAFAETMEDVDGNIYHTVKIGNQVWTVENLRTTRFNDGTPIPHVTGDAEWKELTAPGFCYYENDAEYGKKYGALYNWYAASSDKIAPKGWRVPTHEEQIALRDYLIANGYNHDGTTEENKVAKSMAAKTDWIYKPTNEGNDLVPDIGTVGKSPETNNRSGFSALPAGSRWNDGSFHAIGTSAYWWSTTPDSAPLKAHMSSVHTWFAKFGNNQHHKRSGFSIRLIRDEGNTGRHATTLQSASESGGKSFGAPDKIDVLVVTGGHHFDPEPFFGIFKDCDDIRYVEHSLKDESEVFEDVSKWDYDVVLLYNMTQKISQKRQDNFVRLLKDRGVGVVVVHHAQAAFQSWPEFRRIIGTAYIYFDVEIDGNPWPHCKCKGSQDIAVSVRDDKHPITRGMKDFRIQDETYRGRWWAEGNHVLLTTDHPDNDEPVAWTRQYGRSGVFNVQFGHDKQAYACPEYRDLLIRGVRWAAGSSSAADEPNVELRQTSGSMGVPAPHAIRHRGYAPLPLREGHRL
jgi:uncharacterized protein (TIGR02145 family)